MQEQRERGAIRKAPSYKYVSKATSTRSKIRVDVLHADAGSASLGKGHHPLLDILPTLVVLIQPALGNERIRVGEYALVMVRQSSRHANCIASRDYILH